MIDESAGSPPWANIILAEITRRFPPGPYRIARIVDQLAVDCFNVDVIDRSTEETFTFEFSEWADAIDSLRDGGDPAVEAFGLMLHIHLDERWSEIGGKMW